MGLNNCDNASLYLGEGKTLDKAPLQTDFGGIDTSAAPQARQ
jgi:hypothetical protein